VQSTQEAQCSNGTLSVSPPQSPAGSIITLTASATCQMQNPEYKYWYYTGGNWTAATGYGNFPTYQWAVPSTDQNGTQYAWQVWVREAGSNAAYETYAEAPFTVGPLPPCSSVSTTSTPAGGAEIGTTISLASSAASCGNPEYEVWMLPPGGSWSAVQSYSSSSTYNWDTTGLSAGTYLFQVWARQQGSSAGYEAYDSFSLNIGGPCTAVTESFNPNPPSVGDQVTITASGTCPAPATYKLWVLPPGGSWTVLQDWTSTFTYTADTTGFAAGTYSFQTWVRGAGSTAAYEAYAADTITLSPDCTGGNLTASPSSPASIGTAVTFTGSAASCAAPSYEFWMLAPGGSWTVVQPYGSSATYNWNTTGLAAGTYYFEAWAKNAGSGAAYQTYYEIPFTLQ
jgi:hypothetical protein